MLSHCPTRGDAESSGARWWRSRPRWRFSRSWEIGPPTRASSMRAEIGRLEEQISTNAADVASLRMMADQARAELATLHSQKQAEEASLVTASHAVSAPEAGPALPGADWPFYNPPLRTPRPPVREVIVSAPRHLHLHTARDYLLAARQHVARGRSGDAQTALEKAETRALNDFILARSGSSPLPTYSPNRRCPPFARRR